MDILNDGFDSARKYNAEHNDEYTRLRKQMRKAYEEYSAKWDGGEWKPPPNGVFFWRKYVPEDYPKIDNYDAIWVSRTWDIPCDYPGAMFVPVTFFDLVPMWNECFDIVELKHGSARYGCIDDAHLFGKHKFKRIAIRWQPQWLTPDEYGVSDKEWMAMCGWDEERLSSLFQDARKLS